MPVKLGYPLIVMVTLSLVWFAPALAEDTAPPPSLSLEDCIAIALEHQIDVQVGENTVEGAKQRETKARSGYYPQISVQDSRLLVKSGTRTAQASGTSLTVTENFYDGGLREAQIRGASASLAQSAFGLERTKQTVTFNVTGGYFGLLRALRLAEVQDIRVKYLEEQRALVQARVRVGDAAEVDLLPVEAQLANAHVDQLSAGNAVRTAAIQLQNTMGLSPQPGFSIQEAAEPAATEIHPLADYVATGLGSRPEVGQVRAGVEGARSSVQSTKIALLPRPVISGQFNQSLTDGSSNSLTITGGIIFNIFNGGLNRAAYQEARAGLSSAALRAEQTEKDIQADVQKAYLNLTNAKERLAASDLSLKAAQRNLEAQQGRYKEGLGITLDLLNAQMEVVTAETNAVQARYDYYTSTAQLEYAIGKQGGSYER